MVGDRRRVVRSDGAVVVHGIVVPQVGGSVKRDKLFVFVFFGNAPQPSFHEPPFFRTVAVLHTRVVKYMYNTGVIMRVRGSTDSDMRPRHVSEGIARALSRFHVAEIANFGMSVLPDSRLQPLTAADSR